MNQKIQLIHPQGKKAISMEEEKYDSIKTSILRCLRAKVEVSHKELQDYINKDFRENKIKFQGSLEWHLEWVKLDLEARKEIKRVRVKSLYKYSL
jgi:hypothetical protein